MIQWFSDPLAMAFDLWFIVIYVTKEEEKSVLQGIIFTVLDVQSWHKNKQVQRLYILDYDKH